MGNASFVCPFCYWFVSHRTITELRGGNKKQIFSAWLNLCFHCTLVAGGFLREDISHEREIPKQKTQNSWLHIFCCCQSAASLDETISSHIRKKLGDNNNGHNWWWPPMSVVCTVLHGTTTTSRRSSTSSIARLFYLWCDYPVITP